MAFFNILGETNPNNLRVVAPLNSQFYDILHKILYKQVGSPSGSSWIVINTNASPNIYSILPPTTSVPSVDSPLLPTQTEKNALDAANSPSTINPYATIADIPPPGGTLAQVLVLGNTTGGNDVVVSTGDQVIGQTDLLLSAAGGNNYYYAGPNYLFQQWYDPVSGNTDFLLQGGGTQLFSSLFMDIQCDTGLYRFYEGSSFYGTLNFTNLTANKSFIFPDNSGTIALTSDIPVALSGVYTPTRSAEVNMDGNVIMTQAQYMRVGSTVTVSGRFTADPTLAATVTSFEITLPVASNIGAVEDAAGTAFCGKIAGMGAEVIGVVANDTAKIQWVSSDISSQTWSYTFSYRII